MNCELLAAKSAANNSRIVFCIRELIHAIHRVKRGEPSLEPSIARKVLFEMAHPSKKPTADPLTERELCVLRLASRTQAALYALKTRLASLEDGISGDG